LVDHYLDGCHLDGSTVLLQDCNAIDWRSFSNMDTVTKWLGLSSGL
jgi:hypothetical protein